MAKTRRQGGKARTGGRERVADRKGPHARDELCEAPDEEGHADDDVRGGDPPRLDVVHGQDERRRREAVQPPAKHTATTRISDPVQCIRASTADQCSDSQRARVA